MQRGNPASAPVDDFDKAIASLRDLVASAQRDSQGPSGSEPLSSEAASQPMPPPPEPPPAQSGGFSAHASTAHASGAQGAASQEYRQESAASHHGRPARLTDVLASGIHEATQHVGELIDANRAAHAHLFGPLALPPASGGPRPGASSSTADGHLAGAMWQLKESIKELQAVSHALLSRI